MKGGNHNPSGRPAELQDPKRVTIGFDAATLAKIDKRVAEQQTLERKKKVTRVLVIRKIVEQEIKEKE